MPMSQCIDDDDDDNDVIGENYERKLDTNINDKPEMVAILSL